MNVGISGRLRDFMAIYITGINVARQRQVDREHPASVASRQQVQATLP